MPKVYAQFSSVFPEQKKCFQHDKAKEVVKDLVKAKKHGKVAIQFLKRAVEKEESMTNPRFKKLVEKAIAKLSAEKLNENKEKFKKVKQLYNQKVEAIAKRVNAPIQLVQIQPVAHDRLSIGELQKALRDFQAVTREFQENWTQVQRGALYITDGLDKEKQLARRQEEIIQKIRDKIRGRGTEQESKALFRELRNSVANDKKEDVDALELLVCYDINREHFAKGAQYQEIPQKPNGVAFSRLKELFRKVNFSNPRGAHFYNPAVHFAEEVNLNWIRQRTEMDLGDQRWMLSPHEWRRVVDAAMPEAIRQDAEGILDRFMERVENRQAYVGTPDNGSPALYAFYATIENAICHVIKKIDDMQDGPGKLARIAEMQTQIIRAANHCGPRIYEMAISLYRTMVLGEQERDIDAVYDIAGEFRATLAISRMPLPSRESIVYYTEFMHALGQEFGIPAADLYLHQQPRFQGMGGFFDKNRDRKRFQAHYNPSSVLSWIIKGMKKQDLINLCKGYIPESYKPEVIERAKQEVIQQKRQGKTRDEIIAVLQNKYEMYAISKTQTPEQVIVGARQAMYLEQEVVEDMNALDMQIKPKAILDAIVAAKVLTPVVQFKK